MCESAPSPLSHVGISHLQSDCQLSPLTLTTGPFRYLQTQTAAVPDLLLDPRCWRPGTVAPATRCKGLSWCPTLGFSFLSPPWLQLLTVPRRWSLSDSCDITPRPSQSSAPAVDPAISIGSAQTDWASTAPWVCQETDDHSQVVQGDWTCLLQWWEHVVVC